MTGRGGVAMVVVLGWVLCTMLAMFVDSTINSVCVLSKYFSCLSHVNKSVTDLLDGSRSCVDSGRRRAHEFRNVRSRIHHVWVSGGGALHMMPSIHIYIRTPRHAHQFVYIHDMRTHV